MPLPCPPAPYDSVATNCKLTRSLLVLFLGPTCGSVGTLEQLDHPAGSHVQALLKVLHHGDKEGIDESGVVDV
jgi:hypothetical protein